MDNVKEPDKEVSFEDFLEWSLGELQKYLMVRGKSTTGSKKDLAARALVSFESNDPILDFPKDFTVRLEKEYNGILTKFKIVDPYQIPDGCWSSDITKWPEVNIGSIFKFILDAKAFKTEYIGEYKARKAYSYFKSGHVHQILTYPISENPDLVLLRSSVTPSMRVGEKPKQLWILISKTLGVRTAHCICTAGFSQCCNHIIAVLYKVNFAYEQNYNKPTCTDVPCKFNDRTNYKVQPSKVRDLDIAKHDVYKQIPKHNLLSEAKSSFDPRIHHDGNKADERIKTFFERLRETNPDAVVFLTHTKDDDFPPPITVIAEQTLNECEGNKSDATLLETFMSKLSFSQSQLDELEKETRDQSRSNIWRQQRIGRITASNFHDVSMKVNKITASKGSIKPATTPLLAKLTSDDQLDYLDPIKWGRTNEEKARIDFFKNIAPKHKNPKLIITGLRVFESAPFLSASADNLFTCSCCGTSSVEYKCPFTARNKSINDGWADTDFLQQGDDGNITLKESHKYYTQVQGQMAAHKLSKAYFVVWTTVGDPLIQTINFNSQYWGKTYTNLILFFKLYLAKVLLGLRELKFCNKCGKCILEVQEIPVKDSKKHKHASCTICKLSYHWPCAQITSILSNAWMCENCLKALNEHDDE